MYLCCRLPMTMFYMIVSITTLQGQSSCGGCTMNQQKTMKKTKSTWWNDSYFFGKRYYEPDASIEGYMPEQKE